MIRQKLILILALLILLVLALLINAHAQEVFVPLEGTHNEFISEERLTLMDIYFIDSHNGWIVGGGYGDERLILHTADGGRTWVRQSQKGVQSPHYFKHRGLHFVDRNNGWIVGERCEILNTSTGGLAWLPQDCGLLAANIAGKKFVSPDLTSVAFADTKKGWAVGTLGIVINTENGGITWEQQPSGTNNNLWDVFFIDDKKGWAVGDGGTILHTTNGGNKRFLFFSGWKGQKSETKAILRGVYFIDKNSGWVVGDGGISHTSDGGKSWITQARFNNVRFHKVVFIDRNEGWAVGTNRNNRTGAIAHTEDGGINWKLLPSGTSYDLTSMFFIDNRYGWIVGGHGTILRYVPE